MPSGLKPVGHEERLSIVDHLDELRKRLFICVAVFIVAFGFCMWQSEALLDLINKPLQQTSQKTSNGGRLSQAAKYQVQLRQALEATATALTTLTQTQATKEGSTKAQQQELNDSVQELNKTVSDLPDTVPQREPVTLGVGEPFSTSMLIAAAFALIITMPVLLFNFYAFILPAFTPRERQVTLPLLLALPGLFVAGVLFGYFLILPPAISFLQGFNANSFDVLVQARDYYKFVLFTCVSVGALFELPIVIIALTQLRIISVKQLRKSRRYAIVVIAVVAMLLPGTDPVTMLIAMVPLLVLYEISIVVAAMLEKRRARASTELEQITDQPS